MSPRTLAASASTVSSPTPKRGMRSGPSRSAIERGNARHRGDFGALAGFALFALLTNDALELVLVNEERSIRTVIDLDIVAGETTVKRLQF